MPVWYGQNLLLACLLAAAVALACRLGRLSPAVRHALWLVVLIKLVTPPVISYPASWPALVLVRPQAAAIAEQRAAIAADLQSSARQPLPGEAEMPLGVATSFEIIEAQAAPLPGTELPGTATYPPVIATRISWERAEQTVFAVWVCGALVFLVIQAERILRFRRLLTDPLSDPALEAKTNALARWLGVQPPRVLVVQAAVSPMIWAWGRPKLVWPQQLGGQLTSTAERGVLVHELAHLRRRDHWVGWLELVAGCLWWWNPLYWYVRYQLHENAELACDAWVTAQLPQDRRAYAEALIEVSQLVSAAPTPIAAVGMSRAGRHTFERRLTMIMRQRVPHRVPVAGMFAIGLLGLVVIPGLSGGQDVKPSATPAQAKPTSSEPLGITTEVKPGATPVAADPTTPPVTAEKAAVPATPAQPQPAGAAPAQPQPGNVPPAADDSSLSKQAIRFLQGGVRKGHVHAPPSPANPAAAHGSMIDELERRIADLKKQIELLRAVDGKNATSFTPDGATPAVTEAPRIPVLLAPAGAPTARLNPPIQVYAQAQLAATPELPGANNVHVLTRATYKLPEGKAEAVVAFLKEMLPEEVEAKLDNEAIVITASSEVQTVIARFISLVLKPKPSEKTSSTPDKSPQLRATYPAPVPGASLPLAR